MLLALKRPVVATRGLTITGELTDSVNVVEW